MIGHDDELVGEGRSGETAAVSAVLPVNLPLRPGAMTEEEITALLECAIQGPGGKERLSLAALKAVLAKIKAVEGIQVHAIVGETPATKNGRERTAPRDAVTAGLERIAAELAAIRGAASPILARAGQQPEPATRSDVLPLVAAVQQAGAGNRDAAQQAAAAMRGLAEQIARSASAWDESNRTTMQAIAAAHTISAAVPAATCVVARGTRARVVLAIALLLPCWAAVLWLKVGDQTLALGSVVVAYLVGCCLILLGRRD